MTTGSIGLARRAPRWGTVLAPALLGTMIVGVWLRWVLAGSMALPIRFGHLRHAHSHLGYFGLLFPLAWMGWRAAGAPAPGRRALMAYALCTALACIGFVRSGYGPIAIVGSTAVAAFWLWSTRPLLGRLQDLQDPLGTVPFGLVASLACVPPIALYLRSDPELAHGLVSTFLSGLLLVVIIPSTLAARRVSAGPWPLFLVGGSLGSLYLGVAPFPLTRVGLLAYAGLMAAPVLSPRMELHVRGTWALVGLGLGAMAVGLLPNLRPVALGAIHFLILGPVLGSLAPLWLHWSPPGWLWCLGHASWGTMSVALVLQAFVASPWTWTIAALGGTATLVWWALVLVFSSARHRRVLQTS
ncbi:MAG: hypothetical protein AAGD10_10695 [Myxococcota bacterium]